MNIFSNLFAILIFAPAVVGTGVLLFAFLLSLLSLFPKPALRQNFPLNLTAIIFFLIGCSLVLAQILAPEVHLLMPDASPYQSDRGVSFFGPLYAIFAIAILYFYFQNFLFKKRGLTRLSKMYFYLAVLVGLMAAVGLIKFSWEYYDTHLKTSVVNTPDIYDQLKIVKTPDCKEAAEKYILQKKFGPEAHIPHRIERLESFDTTDPSSSRNREPKIEYFAEVLFEGNPEYSECFEVIMTLDGCKTMSPIKNVSCDE